MWKLLTNKNLLVLVSINYFHLVSNELWYKNNNNKIISGPVLHEAIGWQQSLHSWHTSQLICYFLLRDLGEVISWACQCNRKWCLQLDFCLLRIHLESIHHFYPHRGKDPSKKKSTSHCHHGRQRQEAPLVQWMRPLHFRATHHLLPPAS